MIGRLVALGAIVAANREARARGRRLKPAALDRATAGVGPGRHLNITADPESALVTRIAFRRGGAYVAAERLCFIHVGKTGGATFRQVVFGGLVKDTTNATALRAGSWHEFHVEPERPMGLRETDACDFFVTWVRNPVSRLVSAFEYAKKNNKLHNGLFRKGPARFGNFSNIAEQLYDARRNTTTEALALFSQLRHVRENIAWFFNYGPSTSGAVASRSGSRLDDPDFRQKLLFVGSQECFDEDLRRFFRLFRVSAPPEVVSVHAARAGMHADVERSLSPSALENLRRFARPDYEVLRKMARYGMIRCDALLETL